MKRLGLIGGSGWPSTLEYYRLLNTYYGEAMGSSHSMDMVIRNLDFEVFSRLTESGRQDDAVQMLIDGINDCTRAGAQFFSFSANGLHRFLKKIEPFVSLPNVHIADATAQAVQKTGIKTVGLLGVKATMEGEFYPNRLKTLGITTLVPSDEDKEVVDRIIFSELVHNKFTQASKSKYLDVMGRLRLAGAQGIILGCTEIPLLISQKDFDLPLFATTEIHCRSLVEFALNGGE